jgi:hypothetical protein
MTDPPVAQGDQERRFDASDDADGQGLAKTSSGRTRLAKQSSAGEVQDASHGVQEGAIDGRPPPADRLTHHAGRSRYGGPGGFA